jgi:pantoate--beta-alanine ligase
MKTIILKSAEELDQFINKIKTSDQSLGFVPTMGALHYGHVTLAERSIQENDVSIVSIFVNPTQFNDKKDLDKYVRDLDGDAAKLAPIGLDAIFAPSVDDIYPKGTDYGSDIDLGGLDIYMEGPSRPGHFKGMAQVVKRLLDLVRPDKLYMGQKDFQQFSICDFFIKNLKIPTQLIVCPIIRESNGLAMSSRNERLSTNTRESAGIIYKTLRWIKKNQKSLSVDELIKKATSKINKVNPFIVEYIYIVDGYTLAPIKSIDAHKYVVVCTVVGAEGVRLLDNEIIKKEE